MAYSADSFVFGEQPSTAKWNKLWSNDASFNDGTGIANDVITDAKLIYGKLRSRQGGSATNWSTSGSTTYDYSGTNTFLQTGARAGATGGETTVTFPTPFNQVPVVIGSAITAAGASSFFRLTALSATSFNFSMISTANARVAETCQWIAIGE